MSGNHISSGKHIRALQARANYLEGLVEQKRASGSRHSYDIAELAALKWALATVAAVVDQRRRAVPAEGCAVGGEALGHDFGPGSVCSHCGFERASAPARCPNAAT